MSSDNSFWTIDIDLLNKLCPNLTSLRFNSNIIKCSKNEQLFKYLIHLYFEGNESIIPLLKVLANSNNCLESLKMFVPIIDPIAIEIITSTKTITTLHLDHVDNVNSEDLIPLITQLPLLKCIYISANFNRMNLDPHL